MNELKVSEEEGGLTALAFLQHRFPHAPSAYLRKLLRDGKIRGGGTALTAESIVVADLGISIPGSRRLAELSHSCGPVVEILYETPRLLVVFKPAGLAVHRGVGHEEDNLTTRVQELMRRRREPFRVAPVHRLDVETSGPVIFGKGARALAGLGQQFMDRQVEKIYLTLVAGKMPDSGWLTSAVPAKGRLKEAVAGYETLSAGAGYSLLALRLQTGRTHQLRRQLADAGHPVAGDRRYGGPSPGGLNRLFLHCTRLVLNDPEEQYPVEIRSGLPKDLSPVLTSLGLKIPEGYLAGEAPAPCRHSR